jgi:hypothetical protein
VAQALGVRADAATPPRALADQLVARYGTAAVQAAAALHRMEARRYAQSTAGKQPTARSLAAAAIDALRALPQRPSQAEARSR